MQICAESQFVEDWHFIILGYVPVILSVKPAEFKLDCNKPL